MPRIYLRDIDHIPSPTSDNYTVAEIDSARRHMARRGLSFDPATGVTYRDGTWVSRYSDPADYVRDDNPSVIMFDAFRPHILNCASRIKRGFAP